MRTELAPNMLDAMDLNSRNFDEFQMFEIGRVFCAEHTEERIPTQGYRIGILAFSRKARKERKLEDLFRHVKGVIERFCRMHGFEEVDIPDLQFILAGDHVVLLEPEIILLIQRDFHGTDGHLPDRPVTLSTSGRPRS